MSEQSILRCGSSNVTTPGRLTSQVYLATPLLRFTLGMLLSATVSTITYAQDSAKVIEVPLSTILPVPLSTIFPDGIPMQTDNGTKILVMPDGSVRLNPTGSSNPSATDKNADRGILKKPVANKVIMLSPSMVTVNLKSRAATFRVINLTRDSVPLDFAIPSVMPQTSPKSSGAQPIGTPVISLLSNAAGGKWSMASWIQDMPKSMVLAPHETLTVTIHVTAPPNVEPGKYFADLKVYYKPTIHIDTSSDLSDDALKFLSDTTANGFPVSRYVLGKLVHIEGKDSTSKPHTNVHRKK